MAVEAGSTKRKSGYVPTYIKGNPRTKRTGNGSGGGPQTPTVNPQTYVPMRGTKGAGGTPNTYNPSATYNPNTGRFETPSNRFGQTLRDITGATAFNNANPGWVSEQRFGNMLNSTPSSPTYKPTTLPNYGTPAGREGGMLGNTYVPSWYQAAGGMPKPAGSTYSTKGGAAGRNEGGYVIPAPFVQGPQQPSTYVPTSMPVIERTMDYLNGAPSPYLPSWLTPTDTGNGPDWWGNYRRRGGGGYGGYGGYSDYSGYNPWYTGLFSLNANR